MQYAASDGTYYYGRLSGTRQYNYWWDKDGDGNFDKYFDSEGKMATDVWIDIDFDGRNDYYFNIDGDAVNGVQEIEGNYYYFINNIKQYAASDGTYYYGRLSGTRQYNYWWDKDGDGKKDYYFGLDGKKVFGTKYIDDKYYHFDDSGKMQYGVFISENDYTYYYGKISGTRQYGWITNSGYTYYFDSEGKMVTGNINIDGVDYYFNPNGTWKAGWVEKNGNIYYYYLNNTYATGWTTIAGVKCYFNSSGVLIKKHAKKIIDVSSWQGDINWDILWASGDIDGAIIRVGYTDYKEDEKLGRNISALKRLGIPYGIYVYNYGVNYSEGYSYGEYVNSVINKYFMNPILGIYYDLESNNYTSGLSTQNYTQIVMGFMNSMIAHGRQNNAHLYTYKYYAENVLNTPYLQSLITWIAQYNDICTYHGSYDGWQYTSSGRVTGINGDVDISVF